MKIIINGKEKNYDISKNISYDEVCILALELNYNPIVNYTVAYSYGAHSSVKGGMLVPGQIIALSENMIFNVANTSVPESAESDGLNEIGKQ